MDGVSSSNPVLLSNPRGKALPPEVQYIQYSHTLEKQYLPSIRALISKDLSEPYSIYVYRFFLYRWGDLCFMALNPTTDPPSLLGVIISKLEPHSSTHPSNPTPSTNRGYIAMLAVTSSSRNLGIATSLVQKTIDEMARRGADEVVLETEESNVAAMRLYERLGFLRSKKLSRYYLNGSSAYRLVLWLRSVGEMGRDINDEEATREAII